MGGPGGVRYYELIRIAAPPIGFEGFDSVSGLLHRAGHEPANGVLLPAHLVHDLGQRRAVLPLETAIT